jgi:hypothetical protein
MTEPHKTLIVALAHIDQLVATAQSLAEKPESKETMRILALLKEIRLSLEVAETAIAALKN